MNRIFKLAFMVKSLVPTMIIGLLTSILGYLAGIFAMIIGAEGLALVIQSRQSPMIVKIFPKLFGALIALALIRALLHFGYQLLNQHISAKYVVELEQMTGFDCTDMSIFFSKVLTPIVSAAVVSILMSVFIGAQYLTAGIIAAIAYTTVGGMIPSANEARAAKFASAFDKNHRAFNNRTKDVAQGMDEILQYNCAAEVLADIEDKAEELADSRRELVNFRRNQRLLGNFALQAFSIIVMVVMVFAYYKTKVNFEQMLLATVAMMSSFGPLVALSSLSDNLNRIQECSENILE